MNNNNNPRDKPELEIQNIAKAIRRTNAETTSLPKNILINNNITPSKDTGTPKQKQILNIGTLSNLNSLKIDEQSPVFRLKGVENTPTPSGIEECRLTIMKMLDDSVSGRNYPLKAKRVNSNKDLSGTNLQSTQNNNKEGKSPHETTFSFFVKQNAMINYFDASPGGLSEHNITPISDNKLTNPNKFFNVYKNTNTNVGSSSSNNNNILHNVASNIGGNNDNYIEEESDDEGGNYGSEHNQQNNNGDNNISMNINNNNNSSNTTNTMNTKTITNIPFQQFQNSKPISSQEQNIFDNISTTNNSNINVHSNNNNNNTLSNIGYAQNFVNYNINTNNININTTINNNNNNQFYFPLQQQQPQTQQVNNFNNAQDYFISNNINQRKSNTFTNYIMNPQFYQQQQQQPQQYQQQQYQPQPQQQQQQPPFMRNQINPTHPLNINLMNPNLTSLLLLQQQQTQQQPQNTMQPKRKTKASTKMNFNTMSLPDLIKNSNMISKDQTGCRLLQKKIEEQPEIASKIFTNALPNLYEITTDSFGNYLIQKLFHYLSEEQFHQFLALIQPNIFKICINSFGTRVMQKIIDFLTTDILMDTFLKLFRPIIHQIILDINGSHILLKLLDIKNHLAIPARTTIFSELKLHILAISMHKHGCCVLQKCIDKADRKDQFEIFELLLQHCKTLVSDQCGNYIIQSMVGMGIQQINHQVAIQLCDDIEGFGKQKFSSNVVEKCFECASQESCNKLITALINAKCIITLLFDKFGNYVIQKALQRAEMKQQQEMLEIIAPNLQKLKNYSFGTKLYSKLIVTYSYLNTIILGRNEEDKSLTLLNSNNSSNNIN
jgi:hypothetical protein